MSDYSGGEIGGIVSAALAGLATSAVAIREYLKRERVANAHDSSTVAGISAHDRIIANMQAEIERLSKEQEKMQRQLNRLTGKLASVRMVAIDCYALASECDCNGEHKAMLMAHLKMIVADELKASDEDVDE